ncbi:trypsin-like peptidase domain-containing protein, partial [Bacillus spizizenii]|nr:trypsin-like peptidase domain-containing protein [Bacillus spizizenii]
MVDYDREEAHTTPEQPKRSKKGYFLSSLIGVIVGAVLMAFLMPYFSNEGLDTGTGALNQQQQNNNGRESIRTVNVSVNNAVTKIVSNVSAAVVGVVNIQKSDIWGESGEAGSGSGVIYKKNDNSAYVVTNHHVIEGASQIEISLKDGSRVSAELVGSDQLMDLAVLRVKS